MTLQPNQGITINRYRLVLPQKINAVAFAVLFYTENAKMKQKNPEKGMLMIIPDKE